MQNSMQCLADAEPQTMLHVRIMHRDDAGVMRDSTHDRKDGLAWLQAEGCKAVCALVRIRQFLGLLAFATEERDNISADLVRRVLGEVEDELHDVGDLGWYVRTMQGLLEHAEALPAERRSEHQTPDLSDAPIPCEA